MTRLSKVSRQLWGEYKDALQNLNKMTLWNYDHELSKLVKMYGIDSSPKLGSDFSLVLDLFKNQDGVKEFLSKASGMKFKSLHEIRFKWMYNLGGDGIDLTNTFVVNGLPSLQVLRLEGWNKMDLSKFAPGLKVVLPKVQSQVYIHNFKIDEKVLQDIIFTYSTQCKNLVLRYCFIDEISSDFKLALSNEYKLESLDLFMTAREDDNNK